jgi:hypothetical protein
VSSARCAGAERTCEFGDPGLPMRDRKAIFLPGEQQPWIIAPDSPPDTLIVNSPLGKSVEPFDCLGVDMSFRSRELLHYCKCTLYIILNRDHYSFFQFITAMIALI